MKFYSFSKNLLVAIVPFLLVLIVLKVTIFNVGFYSEEFSKYNVEKNVKDPVSLNQNVLEFIQGKPILLSNEFNEREKLHLEDVRSLISPLTTLMYSLAVVFIAVLAVSISKIKKGNEIAGFVGKISLHGGILAIAISLLLFFSAALDFGSFFDSFHRMFFEEGTYLFDPSSEVIVRLYPENLFVDLGIVISRNIMLASAAIILAGSCLLFKSKRKS